MGHGNGIVQTMNGERESNINEIIRPRQRHTCNEHRRKKLTGNCIKAVDSKEGTLIIQAVHPEGGKLLTNML